MFSLAMLETPIKLASAPTQAKIIKSLQLALKEMDIGSTVADISIAGPIEPKDNDKLVDKTYNYIVDLKPAVISELTLKSTVRTYHGNVASLIQKKGGDVNLHLLCMARIALGFMIGIETETSAAVDPDQVKNMKDALNNLLKSNKKKPLSDSESLKTNITRKSYYES
jgi:hypothetical protein